VVRPPAVELYLFEQMCGYASVSVCPHPPSPLRVLSTLVGRGIGIYTHANAYRPMISVKEITARADELPAILSMLRPRPLSLGGRAYTRPYSKGWNAFRTVFEGRTTAKRHRPLLG
jgi:hypothetical protein